MNSLRLTFNQPKDQENKKGNWAAVSNEMLEYFASSDLTVREFKVVMFLLRQLNGWGLKLTPITLKEVTQGTRLPTNKVAQTLKSLIQKGIIQKIKIDKGVTFHYGFTDNLFYRALPIETQKECHLKLVKSTYVVPLVSTSPVPPSSTSPAPEKVCEPATEAVTWSSKDSIKNILKILKSDEGDFLSQNQWIHGDQTSISDRKEFLRKQLEQIRKEEKNG